MRPIRLDLEGFTAFREPTTIDFQGVETFVLSGPTGSGKSSIIDAITFALYGSVTRYNDPKLVHPIVSQGMLEAKVKFDFEVNGQLYTAVRIVRKVKRADAWGATTKEARLQSGEKILAGTATELDEQIRKLFGLDFEQFTSCVVLPQGEFARFLNAQPNKRQDLLKELLRIQVYDQIGRLARSRTAEATSTKKVYEEQSLEYSDFEASDKKKLEGRVAKLESLLKDIESTHKDLASIETQLRDNEEEFINNRELITALNNVKPPKEYPLILAKYEKATLECEAKAKAVKEAEINQGKVEKKLKNLPDLSKLRDSLRLYENKSAEEEKVRILTKDLYKTQKLEKQLAKQVDGLNTQLLVARGELETEEKRHLAFHLSKGLAKGDICPICERPLTGKPQHLSPQGLKDKESQVEKIEANLRIVKKEHQKVASNSSALSGQVSVHRGQIERIEKSLHNSPTISELKSGIKIIEEVEGELKLANEFEKKTRKEEKETQAVKSSVLQDLKQQWRYFDKVRDSISSIKPPSADKDDLEKSWRALSTWAEAKKKGIESNLSSLSKETTILKVKIEQAQAALKNKLLREGIEAEYGSFLDAIVEAISETKSQLKRMGDGLKKLKELETKISNLRSSIDIGKTLSQHMSANFFERWLLQEAFDNLVLEGSKKLEELTSGDYSFALDERLNFDIVDHRNADEKRSARTLSGGETFLASLALALTLSEQIAQLATEGSAQLESIFLDEGFGTLDPETLDTVANAIEELASRGRIIGLVTHVKELADRIPVQYKVAKGLSTATVEKIIL